MQNNSSLFFVNTRKEDGKKFSHDTEELARYSATESKKLGQEYSIVAERHEYKSFKCDFCNDAIATRKMDGKDTCKRCNPSAYE